MKRGLLKLAPIVVLGLMAMPTAQADEALFQKSGCGACHAVDQQRMGPTLKLIAAKYKGDAEAPARLFDKVRSGGAGVWGKVPMTAIPAARVSDDDLKANIAWVLTH